MGNCNSADPIAQRCTACGYKKCDCTAGLDSQCGKCDQSYKYNEPGTYDAIYNEWVRNNPRPVKPVFDPQPDITAGDFICTQCTQCQDFSNLNAGKSLTISDAQQTQTCIGKIEAAINSQQAAEAARQAEADALAKWQAQQAVAAIVNADPSLAAQTARAPGVNWMLIMFFILIILLACTVGYAVSSADVPIQAPTQPPPQTIQL